MTPGVAFDELLIALGDGRGPIRKARLIGGGYNGTMLTFRNGAIGTITSSTGIYPAHKHLVEVNGENGSAIMNGEYDKLLFRELKGSDEKNDFPADFKLGDITDPHFYPTPRHCFQLMDIVDAIKNNREPEVTREEGMKATIVKGRSTNRSGWTGRSTLTCEPVRTEVECRPWREA